MDTISALLRDYQTACPERKRYLEDVIVQRNYGLAAFIAKKYFNLFTPSGGDDAIQEAVIGMLKAIRTYDPTRGANFATFATM